MNLLRRLSEQRDRHILSLARPHLSDDEEVLQWVRVRLPRARTDGFAYITDRRIVIFLAGRHDGYVTMRWDEVRVWAVENGHDKGPILSIESATDSTRVQIQVRTRGMALNAGDFLKRFRSLAPAESRTYPDGSEGEIRVTKRTPADHTMRVVKTVVGLVLLVAGGFMMVLPGPGLLTLLLGLAVLGSEYDWAKDLQRWAKAKYKDAASKIRERT